MIDRCLAAGGHKNGDDHHPPEVTDFETAAEYECDLTFDDEELQQDNQSLSIFLKLQEFSISCYLNRPPKTTTVRAINQSPIFIFPERSQSLSTEGSQAHLDPVTDLLGPF